MLELNYELRRQEGIEHERVFKVDDGLEIINSNAVYIQAPNAKGKSTFLNILALALYGNKLDEVDCRISKSLKSDIDYIANRENQTYTFNVKITSKDGSIQLISTKDNRISDDIDVIEIINGKKRRLPLATFKDEYFLIYDIPEDPLNRLTEILSEIKNQQIRYNEKVANFKKYLDVIKQEIVQSRDDKEIEKIKQSVFEFKETDIELERIIDTKSTEIKIIESYLALREFKKYVELAGNSVVSIDQERKTKMNQEKRSKTINTKYDNKKKDVLKRSSEIRRIISDVLFKIDELFIGGNYNEIKRHIKRLQSYEVCEGKFRTNEKIFPEIEYFEKEVRNYLKDKSVIESGKKGSFYKTFIDTLEQYKSVDISIPGVDKGMDEFILLLKEEYKKNLKFKMILDGLEDCNNKLKLIKRELAHMSNDLGSLQVLHGRRGEISTSQIDESAISHEIDTMEKTLEEYLDRIARYEKIAHKHGYMIDESSVPDKIDELKEHIREQHKDFIQIFQLDSKSISSEIKSREIDLDNYNKQHSNNLGILRQYEGKLNSLESRELHRYQDNSIEINALSKVIDKLERNLIEYGRIIQKIANGNTSLTSEIENRYNEEISQYFAEKIPEFPYIDEFVKPEKIDFLNKVIKLNGGREIDMKDISTGQSMSMYIQALLNRPKDDKRKMVVIFDEGATMDSNSFKPIKQILKKHIEQNKVLFAVFAKAIDGELKITDLI